MDIQFKPSLELGEMGGFLDLIDSLCHDIYRQSTKVERLADQTIKGDYMVRGGLVRCACSAGDNVQLTRQHLRQ